MAHDLYQRRSNYSRLLRSRTLIRIHWIGILAQTATLLFVALFLSFPLPLSSCMILIAASSCLNIYLTLRYNNNNQLSHGIATCILGFDILQLAILIYLTGGLLNPFALLLIIPAVISATFLPVHYIVTLNLLVILLVSILSILAMPLPWYPDVTITLPRLLIDGIWAAIVAALLFTTAYAYRVAEETRRLGDALMATELILQREMHLSALDGLAAAAAHELGTPLATIQLVIKEMYHQLKDDKRFNDDIELLRSQTDRCRDILKRLTSLSIEGDHHMAHMTLTSLLEETIAPHRDFGIEIITQKGDCKGKEPDIKRNSGLLYGLGNLLENAVDFAKSQVFIQYQWTEKTIDIRIIDDGKGYDPAIMDRIGEPYTSSRHQDSYGGGLGLGLFIAKTLLERNGTQITFRNSKEPELGAEIHLVWDRHSLEEHTD